MAPMKVDLINIEYHDVYAPLCEMCPSWQAARSACWDSCGCARVTGASHGPVALTQPDATKLIMIPILPLWSIKKKNHIYAPWCFQAHIWHGCDFDLIWNLIVNRKFASWVYDVLVWAVLWWQRGFSAKSCANTSPGLSTHWGNYFSR